MCIAKEQRRSQLFRELTCYDAAYEKVETHRFFLRVLIASIAATGRERRRMPAPIPHDDARKPGKSHSERRRVWRGRHERDWWARRLERREQRGQRLKRGMLRDVIRRAQVVKHCQRMRNERMKALRVGDA